jgi:hypothetical protein
MIHLTDAVDTSEFVNLEGKNPLHPLHTVERFINTWKGFRQYVWFWRVKEHRRQEISEEEADKTEARMATFPRKLWAGPQKPMSVSVWLPRPATQLLLHLQSHKTNKVHILYDASCKTKLNSVNWYLDRVHTAATNTTLILFSYKNWFHLSGYAKSLTIKGTGLHIIPCVSIQCFVWHATNVNSITGSILFSETINSPQFLNMWQITKELTCLFWARQCNSSHSTFLAPLSTWWIQTKYSLQHIELKCEDCDTQHNAVAVSNSLLPVLSHRMVQAKSNVWGDLQNIPACYHI